MNDKQSLEDAESNLGFTLLYVEYLSKHGVSPELRARAAELAHVVRVLDTVRPNWRKDAARALHEARLVLATDQIVLPEVNADEAYSRLLEMLMGSKKGGDRGTDAN